MAQILIPKVIAPKVKALTNLQIVYRAVQEANREAAAARKLFTDTCHKVYREGATVAEISKMVGLSRQRIWQILEKDKDD